MRITTGRWKGRALAAPPGDAVRPTSDKVRQAVFNILLGHGLPAGAVVLDAFCGTGALGLEALSRGAAHAIFLDRDLGPCRRNVDSFGAAADATLIVADAVKPGPARHAATLAFLDPPYRQNLAPLALLALRDNGWLADGALCVVEIERDTVFAPPAGFALQDDRMYGGTRIVFLRQKA